jgi:hypothetical protein
MPDFSEILKIAVEQQDWQLICGLYTNITGEALSVPEPPPEEGVEEESPLGDILGKEYSLEELKYQNQLPPQEQEPELVDKDIDKLIGSRYNDFTAPAKSDTRTSTVDGRRMKNQPVGSTKLSSNFLGVNENPFVDDMTDSLVDPNTGEKLVGNNKNVNITPRNQREQLGMNDTSLIDAKCSSCKKVIKVSPSIAFGYSERDSENMWQCNDCSTRRSRRERNSK